MPPSSLYHHEDIHLGKILVHLGERRHLIKWVQDDGEYACLLISIFPAFLNAVNDDLNLDCKGAPCQAGYVFLV